MSVFLTRRIIRYIFVKVKKMYEPYLKVAGRDAKKEIRALVDLLHSDVL